MTVSNYDSQVALNDFRKVDIQTVITTDRESLFLRIQEGCALGPKLGLLAGWRSAQCGTTKPRWATFEHSNAQLASQVYVRRKTSKEELGVIDKQQVGMVRMGEEQVVGERAALVVEQKVGNEEEEEEEGKKGRVVGFVLQGKRIMCTGFSYRWAFLLFLMFLSSFLSQSTQMIIDWLIAIPNIFHTSVFKSSSTDTLAHLSI